MKVIIKVVEFLKMTPQVSLLTAIILFVCTIVSAIGHLPWWVVLVLGLMFVGVATPRVYDEIAVALRRRTKQRRELALVKGHWLELRKLTTELQRLTSPLNKEVTGVICDIARRVLHPSCDYYYEVSRELSRLQSSLCSFQLLLDAQVRNKNIFVSSVQHFENFVHPWHYYYVVERINLLKADLQTAKRRLNEQDQQAYNVVRKWHTDFMDDFVRFAKDVNRDFGEKICQIDLYEALPEL